MMRWIFSALLFVLALPAQDVMVGYRPHLAREDSRVDWSQSINRGLVCWWPINGGQGDDHIRDIVTQRLSNTKVGDHTRLAILGKAHFPVLDTVYSETGDGGDYYDTGFNPLATFAAAGNFSFSVSAWVFKNNANFSFGTAPAVSEGASNGNGGGAQDEFDMGCGDGTTGSCNSCCYAYVRAGGADRDFEGITGLLLNNKWYFLTFTYEAFSGANDIARFYVDGQLAEEQTGIDRTSTDTDGYDTNFRIGGVSNGTRSLAGGISDVRVWDRGLSESEVQALYVTPGVGVLEDRVTLSLIEAAPALRRRLMIIGGGE